MPLPSLSADGVARAAFPSRLALRPAALPEEREVAGNAAPSQEHSSKHASKQALKPASQPASKRA